VNILVIEDDRRLADLIARRLRTAGHNTETCDDGSAGLERASAGDLDLAIVDVMLPGMDGVSLTRTLRTRGVAIPILMLTACDSVPDIVRGLDVGADDYMTKPFSFEELMARLRAIKRRTLAAQGTSLQVADLTLDPASRAVLRGEERVSLSRTEYNLLERLMYRAGKVVSRRSLIDSVSGGDRDIEENTLDAFMRLLRNKIDPPGRPKLIHTVRGVGYMIRPVAWSR